MLEIVLISGQVLECSLAKPQADEKAGGSNSQKSALLPNYPPRVGYGLVDGAYGGLGAQYGAAGFAPVSNVQMCHSTHLSVHFSSREICIDSLWSFFLSSHDLVSCA